MWGRIATWSRDREKIRDAAIVLLILSLYLAAFSIVLPAGINQFFTERSWPRFLALAVILAGLLYARGGLTPFARRAGFTRARFALADLWLVLLPLAPIAQYVVRNQDTLALLDTFTVLAAFVALAVVLSLVVPFLLDRFVSRPLLSISSLVLVFLIANMASLAHRFSWHLEGSLNIQLSVFVVVFSICLVLYRIRKELLYAVIAFYFLSGVLIAAVTIEDEPTYVERSPLYEHTTGKTASKKPDIYLLTYDGYVENETMLQYGIDNSAQEEFLAEHGFKLYKGVYSLGAVTLATMGLVLSPGGGDTYQTLSGDGDVQRTLKRQGYETYGVFRDDYFFRRNDPGYDHNFPPLTSPRLLWTAVFEGEFRFNVGLDNVTPDTFLEKKRGVMQSSAGSPRFMYTHTGPRHSQNSGVCLANETELFAERLTIANVEMKEDVEAILASERDAIIIVNGDHGPYLTKTCYNLGEEMLASVTRFDIQDRLGAFLAIRWPDEQYTGFDQIAILQDVFPAVLAYLFDDAGLLDEKIEAVISEHESERLAGATVKNGIVVGGADNGKPLYESSGITEAGN